MKIASEKITRTIVKHANTFAQFDSKLGSTISLMLRDGDTNRCLQSKLYGYNSSQTGIIVEVRIDGLLLDRVTLTRKHAQGDFEHKYKIDYAKLYHIAAKAPKKAPVDE